ncbi:MAG: hypothetical protein PHU23_19120, partial [Dehalococcoidales bacterium]|nr:hypothetical protein [Dehalococcoidales bacterium]
RSMKGLKDADVSERPAMGRYANELKQELAALLETQFNRYFLRFVHFLIALRVFGSFTSLILL